jgi:hypothetical protein
MLPRLLCCGTVWMFVLAFACPSWVQEKYSARPMAALTAPKNIRETVKKTLVDAAAAASRDPV